MNTLNQDFDAYDPLRNVPDEAPSFVSVDYGIPGHLVLEHQPGTVPALLVRTTVPHPDWLPFRDALSDASPAGVPATIDYAGQFYEILSIAQLGSFTEYRLGPWPDGELHRKVFVLSKAAEVGRREHELVFKRSMNVARFVCPLYPIIGLLPMDVQFALAERVPINLKTAIGWSTLLEVMAGVYLFFIGGVVGVIGGLMAGGPVSYLPGFLEQVPTTVWLVVGPLVLLDALLRWRSLRQGQPRGILPLELLWRLFPEPPDHDKKR